MKHDKTQENARKSNTSGNTNNATRPGTAGESSRQGDQDHLWNAQDATAPSPSDLLPALDERQLSVLRRVGRAWDRESAGPETGRQALPVDPAVGSYPASTDIQPTRLSRFVHVSLQTGQPPEVEATRGLRCRRRCSVASTTT